MLRGPGRANLRPGPPYIALRRPVAKSYGTSISLTGGAQAALWAFLVFYLSCIAITWWFYTRRGALLRDIERGGGPSPSTRAAAQPAE